MNSLMQTTASTTTRTIDPITDPRWQRLLNRHAQASAFHTPGWLMALRRTYGYEASVLTTAEAGEDLQNGLVFCRVKSWLTGRRIVSLPFADHCEPLVEDPEELRLLLAAAAEEVKKDNLKYFEIRPRTPFGESVDGSWRETSEFSLHVIDLRPSLDSLYSNLHKSCIQRKIKRAEKEACTYAQGRSEEFLNGFYKLMLLTRRRHQLPPQPLAWFRNLLDSFEADAQIHFALKDGRPIASIFTLSFKNSVVYKYGCSDQEFHNLGGMPFLFWNVIQNAKQSGATELDLGRSDLDQPGLIEFKEHLGGARSSLKYYSFPAREFKKATSGWQARMFRRGVARVPDKLLIGAGRILYRHLG